MKKWYFILLAFLLFSCAKTIIIEPVRPGIGQLQADNEISDGIKLSFRNRQYLQNIQSITLHEDFSDNEVLSKILALYQEVFFDNNDEIESEIIETDKEEYYNHIVKYHKPDQKDIIINFPRRGKFHSVDGFVTGYSELNLENTRYTVYIVNEIADDGRGGYWVGGGPAIEYSEQIVVFYNNGDGFPCVLRYYRHGKQKYSLTIYGKVKYYLETEPVGGMRSYRY